MRNGKTGQKTHMQGQREILKVRRSDHEMNDDYDICVDDGVFGREVANSAHVQWAGQAPSSSKRCRQKL